jgi:hypothetical protein
MNRIIIATTAAILASTSAFACNGIYSPGIHCPQWEMMPQQPSQPQVTQGHIGNVPFSMQTFTPPAGVYYPQGYRFINPQFGY